jgi:hypothetical protein
MRWAKEHMDSINRQIHTWADKRPYRIIRQQNAEGTRHAVIVRVSRPPRLEQWSLMAGDAFHNLRSALDHLIYAVGMYETDPADPPDPRHLAFPINNSANDFRSKYWRIERLSADVRTEIEALQPYNRPHRKLPPLLAVLRDFDDLDKHRLLHMAFAQPFQGEFQWIDYKVEPGESIEAYFHLGEVIDGTEIAAVTVKRPTPNMDYKLRADLSITLPHARGPLGNDRSAVSFLFDELSTEVHRVIDRIISKARPFR